MCWCLNFPYWPPTSQRKTEGQATALFATEGPAPKPTSLWEIGLRGGGLAVAGFEPTQGP